MQGWWARKHGAGLNARFNLLGKLYDSTTQYGVGLMCRVKRRYDGCNQAQDNAYLHVIGTRGRPMTCARRPVPNGLPERVKASCGRVLCALPLHRRGGRGHVRGHGSGGPTVRALMIASADARGHRRVLGECQLLAVAHTHTLLFGRLGPHRNRVRRHAPKREGNSLLLEERSHAPRIIVSRHSKYAVAAAIRRIRSMQ